MCARVCVRGEEAYSKCIRILIRNGEFLRVARDEQRRPFSFESLSRNLGKLSHVIKPGRGRNIEIKSIIMRQIYRAIIVFVNR